jgi:hypothetical protein
MPNPVKSGNAEKSGFNYFPIIGQKTEIGKNSET